MAGIIENADHEYLVIQRPENGLLAKMWHFPLEEVEGKKYQELKQFWEKEDTNQLSLDLVAEDEEIAPNIFSEWPVVWQKRHFGEVTHVFSHLKWHVLIFYGRSRTEFTTEGGQWLKEASFPSVAFPKNTAKNAPTIQ
ncbi:A/G-specific adenine glycosylase [Tetragenococcus muriaticus 3MR10-3]|uniref:Adenine DNA glycosylase n=1 Tax=Tetragenococcus muriaticus 3MR10-3 TaxID=1302648 RepID=A0A091CCD5_9ENTE|nr:A/G-specific adenine glycosylase [Tetragenococcus muriaticus 3MR10-3]